MKARCRSNYLNPMILVDGSFFFFFFGGGGSGGEGVGGSVCVWEGGVGLKLVKMHVNVKNSMEIPRKLYKHGTQPSQDK